MLEGKLEVNLILMSYFKVIWWLCICKWENHYDVKAASLHPTPRDTACGADGAVWQDNHWEGEITAADAVPFLRPQNRQIVEAEEM